MAKLSQKIKTSSACFKCKALLLFLIEISVLKQFLRASNFVIYNWVVLNINLSIINNTAHDY